MLLCFLRDTELKLLIHISYTAQTVGADTPHKSYNKVSVKMCPEIFFLADGVFLHFLFVFLIQIYIVKLKKRV